MKKFLTIIFVAAFAVFGVFAFSARTNANPAVENPVGENSSVPVKTLYARNCARCHGADGKSQTELGQTMDAPDLTSHSTSAKRNIQIITSGKGGMPGFGKKLKKTEIAALANYVRTL